MLRDASVCDEVGGAGGWMVCLRCKTISLIGETVEFYLPGRVSIYPGGLPRESECMGNTASSSNIRTQILQHLILCLWFLSVLEKGVHLSPHHIPSPNPHKIIASAENPFLKETTTSVRPPTQADCQRIVLQSRQYSGAWILMYHKAIISMRLIGT